MFVVVATLKEQREDGWNMEQRTSETWDSLPEAFYSASTLAYPQHEPGSWITSDGATVYVQGEQQSEHQQIAFFQHFNVKTRSIMRRIVEPDILKKFVPYVSKHEIVQDQAITMRRWGFEICATPPGFSLESAKRSRKVTRNKSTDNRNEESLIDTIEKRLEDILYFKGIRVRKHSCGGLWHTPTKEMLFTDNISPQRINEVLDYFARTSNPRLPDIRTPKTLRKHFVQLEWLREQARYGEKIASYIEDPHEAISQNQPATTLSENDRE